MRFEPVVDIPLAVVAVFVLAGLVDFSLMGRVDVWKWLAAFAFAFLLGRLIGTVGIWVLNSKNKRNKQ